MTKLVEIKLDDIQIDSVKANPAFDVEEMLGNGKTAHLILGDQVYILRRTRQNKLLLTK